MEKVLQQNNRRYQQWQSQIHSNHQKTQDSEAAMQDTLIFIENKLTGLHTRWSTAGDFQAQRRSLEFSQDQTDALAGQKTLQHCETTLTTSTRILRWPWTFRKRIHNIIAQNTCKDSQQPLHHVNCLGTENPNNWNHLVNDKWPS